MITLLTTFPMVYTTSHVVFSVDIATLLRVDQSGYILPSIHNIIHEDDLGEFRPVRQTDSWVRALYRLEDLVPRRRHVCNSLWRHDAELPSSVIRHGIYAVVDA